MADFPEIFFRYFRPLPSCFKYKGNKYDLLLKGNTPNIKEVLSLLDLEGFRYVYSYEVHGYFCELPAIH